MDMINAKVNTNGWASVQVYKDYQDFLEAEVFPLLPEGSQVELLEGSTEPTYLQMTFLIRVPEKTPILKMVFRGSRKDYSDVPEKSFLYAEWSILSNDEQEVLQEEQTAHNLTPKFRKAFEEYVVPMLDKF